MHRHDSSNMVTSAATANALLRNTAAMRILHLALPPPKADREGGLQRADVVPLETSTRVTKYELLRLAARAATQLVCEVDTWYHQLLSTYYTYRLLTADDEQLYLLLTTHC